MVIFVTNILAVIVLGVIVWRRGRDRRPWMAPAGRSLLIAGLVVLGLVAAVYLVFGVGEMLGDVAGGAGHLIELLAVGALLILAWMRPLEGGIAIFACGVLSALGFFTAMLSAGPIPQFSMISPALMITSLPQVLSGGLLFAAGMLGRKTAGTPAQG